MVEIEGAHTEICIRRTDFHKFYKKIILSPLTMRSPMKKHLLIAAFVGSSSFYSVAFAQSSVTLYGILDESIQYTHNVAGKGPQVAMFPGQLVPDKWGMRGEENLGDGMKLVFKLENTFNITNGQSSRMFSRSYVGISDDLYGTLTVGRQYDPLYDVVLGVQGNNFLEYFTAAGDVDDGDGSILVSNAVKWTSPAWGGVQAEAMYSVGGIAGSTGSGQTYSAAVSYSHLPFTVAAGYFHIDNGNATLSTRGASTADSIFNSPVNAAYASARSINILRTGATYAIGPVTVGADYSFSEYIADANSLFKDSERYDNGAVFAFWSLTPAVHLELGYDYLKSHGSSSATYQQIALAGDYILSKRTDLYAIGAYGRASGSNGIGIAQTVISDSYAAPGSGSQQIAIVGIRHRF